VNLAVHRHVRYYDRVYVEKTLNLDESLVKEYFPVSVVVPTILKIYQDLLGVKFVEIKDDSKDVWHPGMWHTFCCRRFRLSDLLL
jgi:Zn-dependent oligopeptidase